MGDAGPSRSSGVAFLARPVGALLFATGATGWAGGGRWRLAFLLALPLGLVGLYIRLRIEETPGFRAIQHLAAAARAPLADTLRTARRAVTVGDPASELRG